MLITYTSRDDSLGYDMQRKGTNLTSWGIFQLQEYMGNESSLDLNLSQGMTIKMRMNYGTK